MKVLGFGGGGLSNALASALRGRPSTSYVALLKTAIDVRDYAAVVSAIGAWKPDFVVCTAGLSDRVIGVSIQEVIDVNLRGAINVATAAKAYGTPCLLIGSTAGMQAPAEHPWYGPAKAGVIAHVAAAGRAGHRVYCLSPNRMDTPMRDADWPTEAVYTRLDPARDVAPVMLDIMDGRYPPGANVVVRKVGVTGRVDVFQAPTVVMEGMLDVV